MKDHNGLNSFRVTNKAEAGRQLVVIEKKIRSIASKFNSKRTIPLLLCLEDAVENLGFEIIRSHKIENKFQDIPQLYLPYIEFILGFYKIIDELINVISIDGFYDPTTKIELPMLAFGIGTGDKEAFQQQISIAQQERKISVKATILPRGILFLNRIPGYYYVSLEPGSKKRVRESLVNLLSFRNVMYQKYALEAMIHTLPEGAVLELGYGDSTKFIYPEGITHESLSEKIGLTPRTLDATTPAIEWNSYFQEISRESLKIRALKGKVNIKNLNKERREVYNAYSSMKDFPKTFERLYGVDLQVFSDFVEETMKRCYDHNHSVGIWKISEFLNDKTLIKEFGPKKVETMVDLLLEKTELPAFVRLKQFIFTNFRRLINFQLRLLDWCFNEVYDKNLKGKAFEKACRKLTQRKGLKTIPKSVEIFEPVLPLDVSISLFGKQKNRTDIDVVATRGNHIFIIECKQIKGSRHKLHEQNQFRKFAVEIFYKAKWISSNFKAFKEYSGEDSWNDLGIDQKRPIYLTPLIVANQIVDLVEREVTILVTYTELKELLSKISHISSQDESGVMQIEIGDKNINLIWLLCKKN